LAAANDIVEIDEWNPEGGATMSSEKTQSPCEDFARDCVRLAQHPLATPQMRKQLLAQAREWMQMAIEEQEGNITDRTNGTLKEAQPCRQKKPKAPKTSLVIA
jgi:hypothetical protein